MHNSNLISERALNAIERTMEEVNKEMPDNDLAVQEKRWTQELLKERWHDYSRPEKENTNE